MSAKYGLLGRRLSHSFSPMIHNMLCGCDYELIEREEINYQDFQELKLAIESLGGDYEKERDFSNDKVYRKIMEQKKGMKS